MLESNHTERTRVTDTPNQTQLSIDRALQDARIGLWVWDMQSNNVYFSPEWKRQLGYQDHELKSRFGEFEDRLHPQDRQQGPAELPGIPHQQADPGAQRRQRQDLADHPHRQAGAGRAARLTTGPAPLT